MLLNDIGKFATNTKINFNYKNKTCPNCKRVNFIFDKKDYVVYCAKCGLVVQASYNYTSGNKFILDFGFL